MLVGLCSSISFGLVLRPGSPQRLFGASATINRSGRNLAHLLDHSDGPELHSYPLPDALTHHSQSHMQFLSFDNGDEMPMLGLGTWKSAPNEAYEAVKTALEVGYRHIDCAAIYKNEAEVGDALTESFEAGVADREDVWITSKLWNDAHAPEHVRPPWSKRSMTSSLTPSTST